MRSITSTQVATDHVTSCLVQATVGSDVGGICVLSALKCKENSWSFLGAWLAPDLYCVRCPGVQETGDYSADGEQFHVGGGM